MGMGMRMGMDGLGSVESKIGVGIGGFVGGGGPEFG